MLIGLRTVIYKTPDLSSAKTWYRDVFGITPYFDEPFYVGFNVGGFELGLDPDCSTQQPGPGGGTAYWGVASLTDTLKRAEARGGRVVSPAQDVGEGIRVATIEDPSGNLLGLIENPHFKPNETK